MPLKLSTQNKAERFDLIVAKARSSFETYKKFADTMSSRIESMGDIAHLDMSGFDTYSRRKAEERYDRRVAHENYKILLLADSADGLVCGCHLCDSPEKAQVSA